MGELKKNVEDHPLYDTALTETVEAIPKEVPQKAAIVLNDVRELMVMAWLRGAAWAATHPDLARQAYESFYEEPAV